jgi:hypothetical protein
MNNKLMDKFYISGVVDFGDHCERVIDEEAKFWTVYERLANGTSQAICDCDSRENAEHAAERMNELTAQVTSLTNAITFAVDPMLWCQREIDIFQYRGKVWYADVLNQAISKENADEQ